MKRFEQGIGIGLGLSAAAFALQACGATPGSAPSEARSPVGSQIDPYVCDSATRHGSLVSVRVKNIVKDKNVTVDKIGVQIVGEGPEAIKTAPDNSTTFDLRPGFIAQLAVTAYVGKAEVSCGVITNHNN